MHLTTFEWTIDDFAQAMANAINQHANHRFLRQHSNVIKFNGFWRDGDKQNVCAWLDTATWHDAKTGEGGGCKDFAKIAFNLELKDFMNLYGSKPVYIKKSFNLELKPKNFDLTSAWNSLVTRDKHRFNHANEWLEKTRKFNNPQFNIGSGFASLYEEDSKLFDMAHRGFLKQRLAIGPQLVAPIRGASSDKVLNLFFRSINNSPKEQKSRLLPDCGGFGGDESSPRAFGFPYLIKDFHRIILCEGMADYFAVECLLDACEKSLPIGVPGVAAFDAWISWLCSEKYSGKIIILYQLDYDKNGRLEKYGPGQNVAVKARKTLCDNKINAKLFNWTYFIEKISDWSMAPKDIADTLVCSNSNHEFLHHTFCQTLRT